MSIKREVVYTLSRQRGLGPIVPVASYPTYVDAFVVGRHLPSGWHMRIDRHVIQGSEATPATSKFAWAPDDVVVESNEVK